MMKVKDMMVSSVCSCHPDTMLDTVARTMWDKDCGAVPVVDQQNRPVGIITDRDIAIGSVLQHRPLWEMQASSITNSRQLFTCKENDDIHRALALMQEQGVRRLPVVNGKGELKGIISLGDIVASASEDRSDKLPLSDLAGMLKAVSGHHAPQLQAA